MSIGQQLALLALPYRPSRLRYLLY
jgi:hypothetical protein